MDITQMGWNEWLLIAGSLCGPILAVQAQGIVDRRRELRRRRLSIFFTLMQTRATNLAAEHVNALNAIPLEFSGTGAAERAVRTAWKVYFNHLNTIPQPLDWGQRRILLMSDLLQKLGSSLKYDFDVVELEKDVYLPTGHTRVNSEQDTIREGFAALFRGETQLPMSVKSWPSDPAGVAAMQENWRRIAIALETIAGMRRSEQSSEYEASRAPK